MTYVMSDVHGFYSKFLDFVDDTKFSDEDTLYIIGDIIDRGPDGIPLLLDVMKRKNVIVLKGNHEMMMYPIFEEIYYNPKDADDIIAQEMAISDIGQEQTLRDFAKLSDKQKINILNFINRLEDFKEITVNSKNYLLVHGGLPDFKGLPLEYYEEDDLLLGQHDFDINHYENTTVIVGHAPTRFISDAVADKIFYCNDSIDIDCGLGFGGKLGVICLDTGEEMYY